VKFGCIAKHRRIWQSEWLCGALGVSRGGFYAWMTRPLSRRSRSDEDVSVKVRANFLASDRTYGARRVWHDLLAEGVTYGLHRIERLMRQALKQARDGVDCRLIWVSGWSPPSLPTHSTAASMRLLPTANGSPTSPMCGQRRAGSMWPPSSLCSPLGWLVGR
jgi:HTH-like domain